MLDKNPAQGAKTRGSLKAHGAGCLEAAFEGNSMRQGIWMLDSGSRIAARCADTGGCNI